MPLHPLFVHFQSHYCHCNYYLYSTFVLKKINLSITLTTLLTTGMVFGIISYILGDSGEAFAINIMGCNMLKN